MIRLFATLTIVVAFAVVSFGQGQSSNATITGLANVAAQVLVTGTGSLEFGNVTPGITKTISYAGAVVAGLAGGTTETEGKFTVTKGANTQVTLAFVLPTTLVSGGNTLPINFLDYGGNKCGNLTGTGSNAADFTPASGISTANSAPTAWAFAAATFNVHIGGTVVPPTTQASGAYTGNIQLTATYN